MYKINQIWSDTNYAYAATISGLDIYDITSESKYAYINYSGGFNTIWGNEERIFLGTSDTGIKYLYKTCISGSIITPIDLLTCLMDFYFVPGTLTSQNVRYVHGNASTVMVVTDSGVDVIKYGPQGYHSFTLVSGGTKCFMTSINKCYYITNDGSSWSLNRLNTCLGDWATPSFTYTTGSGILAAGIGINDLFVTEYTGTSNANVLFVATTSGVYLIDEGSASYSIYYVV